MRTKDKILKIDSFEKDMRNIDCVCFTTGEIYTKELLNEIITKHSKNLIDLIEKGDYVNGQRVIELIKLNNKEVSICVFKNKEYMYCEILKEDGIKTILTHEQFEQNCYRLEE